MRWEAQLHLSISHPTVRNAASLPTPPTPSAPRIAFTSRPERGQVAENFSVRSLSSSPTASQFYLTASQLINWSCQSDLKTCYIQGWHSEEHLFYWYKYQLATHYALSTREHVRANENSPPVVSKFFPVNSSECTFSAQKQIVKAAHTGSNPIISFINNNIRRLPVIPVRILQDCILHNNNKIACQVWQ